MTDSRGNRICVSPMAVLDRPLTEQLDIFERLEVDCVGLAMATITAAGILEAKAQVAKRSIVVDYLVIPLWADPSDGDGYTRQLADLATTVRTAAEIGARLVYFTSGPSGRTPVAQAEAQLTDRLAPVVADASDLGVHLAIENTSPVRADLSFTHTVRDALRVAEQCGTGICLDLYGAWQEPDLPATMAAGLDRIELVQVADLVVGTQSFPNRWVPGDGDLPLARLLDEVLAAGYSGAIDLEMTGPEVARQGAETALRRGIAWIAAQLERESATQV